MPEPYADGRWQGSPRRGRRSVAGSMGLGWTRPPGGWLVARWETSCRMGRPLLLRPPELDDILLIFLFFFLFSWTQTCRRDHQCFCRIVSKKMNPISKHPLYFSVIVNEIHRQRSHVAIRLESFGGVSSSHMRQGSQAYEQIFGQASSSKPLASPVYFFLRPSLTNFSKPFKLDVDACSAGADTSRKLSTLLFTSPASVTLMLT